MNLTEINLREKEFHNKLHSGTGKRKESFFYKALANVYTDFFDILLKLAPKKEVLDFGCGTGSYVKKVASFKPKKIIGIDISENSIEKAKKNNSENINITDFKVGNCEDTKLGSEQFDLVYGSAILHHLEFNKSLDEIHRLLKINGSLVFIEPMATNPFINFYRFLTPKSRSKDEHPLRDKDLEYIKSKFGNFKIRYYGFFTLVFILFYRSPDSKIFKFLKKIDHIFLNNNFVKGLAWTVIITAKKN